MKLNETTLQSVLTLKLLTLNLRHVYGSILEKIFDCVNREFFFTTSFMYVDLAFIPS